MGFKFQVGNFVLYCTQIPKNPTSISYLYSGDITHNPHDLILHKTNGYIHKYDRLLFSYTHTHLLTMAAHYILHGQFMDYMLVLRSLTDIGRKECV